MHSVPRRTWIGPAKERSENRSTSFPERFTMAYVDPTLVTTAFELPGLRIARNLGLVRGIVCRSRSVIGNFAAGIQTIFGGNITLYTELCETARSDAFRLMMEHAGAMGANAVIGVRYDANEVMAGVTEVLAYGTAVVVEPISG
jgi:uncharacterized protein YbjQ (UPF0145 family)